ncbi:MAG TPA: hypothetical protein VEY92_04570 [Pseudoxanthomonas sp.]|nr:hypothetical protein [Pseudoxanthomonas sp.]
MKTTRINRSKAIAQWLSKQTTPKTTRQIWLAVAPFDRIALVSAAVCQLIQLGKVEKVSEACRGATYRATAHALIDKRLRVDKKPRKSRPKAATTPADPSAPCLPTPPLPGRVAHLQHSAKGSNPPAVDLLKLADHPHHKHQAADLIASDVERFLRAGGRIETLDSGAVSQPLRMHLREGISIEAAAAIDRKTARRKRAADSSLT